MQSQTVSKVLDQTGQWLNNEWQTSGTYKIIDLYEPEYQRAFTRREAPPSSPASMYDVTFYETYNHLTHTERSFRKQAP